MTSEEEVCYGLLDYFGSIQGVEVHSYHPPSAKGYQGTLIRIPRKERGVRTRDRYHVDFILQVGDVLVLLELKGRASELEQDIDKLAAILSQYSVGELKAILGRRVKNTEVLAQAAVVLPAVGYQIEDRVLPDNLLQFISWKGKVRLIIGDGLPTYAADVLRKVFGAAGQEV